MNKSNLLFSLQLKYNGTTYPALMRYAVAKPIWLDRAKRYLWIFWMKHIEKVKEIAKPFNFVKEDQNFYLANYKPIKEKIKVAETKGKGWFDVVDMGKIYQISTVEGKKDINHNLDKNIVKSLWRIVSKYPLKKVVRSRTVAEHQCIQLGITRFNRKTGTFSKEQFWGCRPDYKNYFYYPTKVLQKLGLITYYKWGGIERIKNRWEEQEVLEYE